MATVRFSWAAALVALLIATLLPAAAPAAQAQDARLVWSPVWGVPAEVSLHDVFMVGPNLAWAVGSSRDGSAGYAYRLALRDGQWRVSREGIFRAALYGVAAFDAENIWAVGDYGLIVRRDQTGWREVAAPSDRLDLRDIQLLGDGSAAWAVGSERTDSGGGRRAAAIRYDGRQWRSAAVEGPADFSYMEALHLNNGGAWAVGTQIWRLQGDTWRSEAAPNPCGEGYGCAPAYLGVRALDGEQAVLVGSRRGICAACSTNPYIALRGRGGWSDPFPNGLGGIIPEPPQYPQNAYLTDVFFTDAANGLAIGARNFPGGAESFALRYRDNEWRYEPLPGAPGLAPTGLFMADPTRALAVGADGLVLSYGYGPQPGQPVAGNPAAPITNPNQPGVRYFAETGHTLRGTFLRYWEQNGGLARFGYPRTEEFAEVNAEDGRTYTVQYFERARFEYHPELAGTQYEVLLGLLGHWVTADRKQETPFLPTGPSGAAGAVYFPETGHTMAPEFVEFWRSNGGLAIYGYPISEAFYEVNAADGQRYLVQYFERNRFEHHPEQADPRYRVLLGLLGNEYLRSKGWQ